MADEKMTLGKLAEAAREVAAAEAKEATYKLDTIITSSVTALLSMAVNADDAGDAMRLSQAALNTAHVRHALADRQ